MVNGAGLAMATMDMIKLSGGEPANFLDVGGTANAQTVEAGFRIILKDPKVKAILINIFGGIVRCDRVAQGVIDAYTSIGNINIPIIVRLQGTNADIAKKLIDESGLKVQSAIQLSEAAELVNKAVACALLIGYGHLPFIPVNHGVAKLAAAEAELERLVGEWYRAGESHTVPFE